MLYSGKIINPSTFLRGIKPPQEDYYSIHPAPLLTEQIDQMVLVVATVFLPLLFVSGKSGAGFIPVAELRGILEGAGLTKELVNFE